MSNTLAIIGGGPAGLMAAEVASAAGAAVTVFDAMPSFGRKFLRAGVGGLNLTHSEAFEPFLARYGDAAARLRPYVEAFPPSATIAWAEALGQATFAGSSGRVFPQAMKASPLLRAWMGRLASQGVRFQPRAAWRGWADDGALVFEGAAPFRADAVVLALGGASWPRLGSDGGWAPILAAQGVVVAPFRPANMGFDVAWSPMFRERFAGAALKGVGLRFEGRRARADLTVTAYGLEGGAVYALSAPLRDAIAARGRAEVFLDLRPDLSQAEVVERLSRAKPSDSRSNRLRKTLGLSPVAVNLLHETGARDDTLVIKALRLTLTGTQPLARAISTAGGVAFDAVDETLMLRARPGVFVAGEMLDWEAPTGGYLLQAAFATGAAAGAAAARFGLPRP